VRDPSLVIETIAQSLGIRAASARPLEQALVEHLQSRHLLLVLDNFEQMLGAQQAVGSLLAAAGRVKVLITSREALGTYGEHVYTVPTLGLPDPAVQRGRTKVVQRSAAERLFLERARATRPNFASDADDQALVADICRRLDGLPLAIELAASRARTMGPKALLQHLGKRLDLLSAGPTDFSPRQRSIRGALDWSYELLDDAERRFFGCISVFVGGATLEAIAAVCGNPEDMRPSAQVVENLADKSLLQVREVADMVRFEMLETIREYASELLATCPGGADEQELRHSHAAFFASFAERARDELSGPDQITWLQSLDADHDNFRAALDWSLVHRETELAARLCAALWPFWRARGDVHEGRRRLSATLALGGEIPGPLRAAMLNGAGALAIVQSDYARATHWLTESRDLYAEQGDPSGVAYALSNLGIVAHDTSDADRAQTLFQESLRLRRSLGEYWGEASALLNLGMIALERGTTEDACQQFEDSARLFRRVGDWRGLAQALSNLGWATQELGDYARATALFSESLTLAQRLETPRIAASNLSNLGLMALYGGDYVRAGELFGDSLAAFVDLGDKRGEAESLEGLAGVAGVQGRPQDAARLFGRAEAIREAVGAPLLPHDRSRYASTIAAAREQLDDQSWRRAWAEGRGQTADEGSVAVLGSLG
jgi:predicted ATPase/Tfp pilus assembly protein PilF